jgi:hypothetical protein
MRLGKYLKEKGKGGVENVGSLLLYRSEVSVGWKRTKKMAPQKILQSQ